MFGQNVYRARKSFGRQLAQESPVQADVVISRSGLWSARRFRLCKRSSAAV